ncbi:integrator complex subunit 12-like isoform X1 [Vespula maculifrons]|uniref:Integrator complex subunit 12-like isoform X1 n=1 Tax=Vespula maculifrons TaxID=7453 RepID=A0ABD2B0S4_VESMC
MERTPVEIKHTGLLLLENRKNAGEPAAVVIAAPAATAPAVPVVVVAVATGCTPVNTSAVTTLVFGMPGMAQRIWTTHTPAAQPVCAHADTAYAAAGETRSRERPRTPEPSPTI